MKHSVSGDSMTEVLEPKVVIPCPVKCGSVLQKLYIDLCNLIVESRIPRLNEKGYGDGIHCSPLLGRNTHGCDLSKPECQKHERLIQHLLRAVGNHVFEIEVLVLPDCCTDCKLKERIQNREYRLLEKWSMKCIYSKVQSTLVDVPLLLRAVRSFLHFSQLSAWLSSTKGKSPSNIYYWVKSSSDGLSTKFEHEPEEHSFPVCKITEDVYGIVKVKYPPRTQYVPIIPCSKHPPLHGYSFRTVSDSPGLHQNISLNSQVVRQLHKPPCDDQLGIFSENNCVSEPSPLLLPPVILKTFTGNIADGNRVLKQSFCSDGLVDSSNLSFEIKQSKSIDLLSKSQTSYLCNYAETYSNGLSQENVCFDTSQLIEHFRKKKFRIRRINRDENSTSLNNKSHQSQRKHSTENVSSPTSNSLSNVTSTNGAVIKCEASPVNETYHHCKSEQKKSPKRKILNTEPEKSAAIPPKKVYCGKYLSEDYQISLTYLNQIFSQKNDETSQVSCNTPVISTSVNLNIENGSLKAKNCVGHEIETVEPTVSTGTGSRPLKCFSVSSTETNAKNERANQKNCRKRKFLKKLVLEESVDFANMDTKSSSETRACSVTSAAETDDKNELKKVKLMDDCVDNFSFSEPSSLNVASKLGPVYKPAINYKNSEKMYVCRRRFSRSDSSDLWKYQISPSSNCKGFYTENLSDGVHKFSSTLQTESKSNELLQRNYLQNLKSKFLSIHREKSNRRLEAKLLKRYNRVFASKHRGISHEAMLVDYNESNSECKSCNRTHLNFSKCCSRGRKLNNLSQKMRKRKKTSNCLVGETIRRNSSGLVETKNLELTENKSRRITEKRMYKSYKKLFNATSCNVFSSSLPHKFTNTRETLCTSDNCQCQESQSNSQLSKRISRTSAVPAARILPESLVLPCETERNYNILQVCKSEPILEPNEIILPNDRQCPFVLNRLVPFNKRNWSCEKSVENLGRFPKSIPSFPKGRKLLANFEESILKGCLPTVSSVKGFHAEIGASGSFFPSHLTLPANVSFYELGNSHQGTAPYVAHVVLGDAEYYLPKKGAVQVTLFNPSETVVKMFVLNYDLSSMPPMCHTFIRQKIYYLPIGSTEEHPSSPKWLRFIIHLRFASSKTGKIFLHKDFKIVVLNKSNDDAASEFNQEPRELRSFVSVPRNPTFSNF